jgi:5,5'-dehydrodivanillate O-demethylase
MTARKHLKIAFDEFEFGISKRRLLEGDTEDSDDWTVGHPVIFPAILAVGDSTRPSFQIRVPRDDTSTLHFWYRAIPRQPDAPVQTSVPIYDYPHAHPNGKIVVETVQGQDMMAWITQGEISDRSTERLGTSDKGVILYRGLLMREMERAARGEDPLGVLRDPAKNEPMIRIPREGQALRAFEVNRDLLAVNLKELTGSEV